MRKQMFLTSLAVTAGLSLSACATSQEAEDLRVAVSNLESKIEELEAEVETLKTDLGDRSSGLVARVIKNVLCLQDISVVLKDAQRFSIEDGLDRWSFPNNCPQGMLFD